METQINKEVTLIIDNDSYDATIKIRKGIIMGDLRYVFSPTSNCQLASFQNAYLLRFLTVEEILSILSNLEDSEGLKNIILLDINARFKIDVLNKIKPLSQELKEFPYISSNGSDMVLILWYLDREGEDEDDD